MSGHGWGRYSGYFYYMYPYGKWGKKGGRVLRGPYQDRITAERMANNEHGYGSKTCGRVWQKERPYDYENLSHEQIRSFYRGL